MVWIRRGLSAPARHLAVARAVARAARRAEVVYATTMVRRAALGSLLARRPLVVKLVADEAYERERRSGRFTGTLADFQAATGGLRVRVLRATRTAALRRARRIVVPSAYLREIALGWGLEPERVVVIPNPAPQLGELPSREGARAALGIAGPTLGTAGRLTAQKALGDALAAVARVDGVSLVVLGDGPERAALERRSAELGLAGRVRFLGAGTRDDVVRLFRAADAALLTSAWENLPHTLLEALAVGTPVIATAVGGIPEVVRDGENGLLVPPGDVGGDRRRDRAAPGRRLAPGRTRRCGSAVGRRARRAAYPRPDRGGARGSGAVKPRVLMVGRTRYRLPLDPALAKKFDALGSRLRLRVLGAAPRDADGRGRHVLAPARDARSRRSTGRRSTARCRSGSRASSGASAPTRSSPRARTRHSRRSPGVRWRGATRPSSSRSTATGAPGRGSTARPPAPSSRRSPTAPLSSPCGTRTPCARSRPSRRASFAPPGSSRQPRSRRTPT